MSLHRTVLAGGLAVGLIAAGPAIAAPCGPDGLRVAEKLSFKPFVLSKAADVRLASSDCHNGRARFAFESGGAAIATVDATAGQDRIDVRFAFARPMNAVDFGVSATANAQSLESFTVKGETLRADGKNSLNAYYPYAWNTGQKTAVREADSVIPGFKAGGLNVVYDTPKLGALVLSATPGKMRALFPHFTEANRGGDVAVASGPVRAGQTADMRFYFHASLAHIQDRRFATPDRRGMRGVAISQFVPKAWTPSEGVIARSAFARDKDGAWCGQPQKNKGRVCFATRDEMQAFAEAMPGRNDIVVARIALPDRRAADAIRAGGARPFYYLFFGALATRDNDASIPAGWVLKDSAGKPHLAPYSNKSKGHWRLLDLTQKPARDAFVARALEALDAGYEGIFMDGGFLWNMPNGKVGGDNPGAAMSQNQARHLLMAELRAAIRARNPAARLGVLANRYLEYMHYADFVVREGAAARWLDVRRDPHRRTVLFDPKGRSAKVWHQRYGRLATTPVFYACKGPNAVIVRSCREAVGVPNAGFYYDSGDWHIYDTEVAAGLIEEIYGPGDLYVTRTEGDRPLAGIGVSGLRFQEGGGRVWFSRQVPLLRKKTGNPLKSVGHTYKLAAAETYIPADRQGPDGWRWAREGFVYGGPGAYIAGDFYVAEAPRAAGDGVRVILAPEPRRQVRKDTARPGYIRAKPPTLRFRAVGQDLAVAYADGGRLPAGAVKRVPGGFEVTLAGERAVAVRLSGAI